MLSGNQINQFERNGFLNAGVVLENEEIDDLCNALEAVLAKGPEGFGHGQAKPVLFHNMISGEHSQTERAVYQIVNIWEAAPAFERLLYHPFIVQAIHQLTSFGSIQIWHDQIQYKPPQSGGANAWHQDAPYWPSIEPMTPVSAWIALDNVDELNGCMWMVPGSHRWGNQIEYLHEQKHLQHADHFCEIANFTPPPDQPIQQVDAVSCPVKRGEVHFHHSLTWHGSPENASSRARRAIAIHYMSSEARFTGREHVMKQFIKVDVGQAMLEAGNHFPIVFQGGQAVEAPKAPTFAQR